MNKTTLISVRVPQRLLERFDALVRERAYRQGQRVTRNSAIVELLESAVQDQERPT
jgi:metal-responsive CopG/Arc/MetJ family transcriptional regulator